jgi:hypothetical protein
LGGEVLPQQPVDEPPAGADPLDDDQMGGVVGEGVEVEGKSAFDGEADAEDVVANRVGSGLAIKHF